MTNPEAAAWLEGQIDLGEGVAASGGWMTCTPTPKRGSDH